MASDEEPPIYRALMALKPADLKLGTWATRAGMARNVFNGIRAHGNPTSATLEKLLAAIEMDMAALNRAMGATVKTEVRDASDALDEVRPIRSPDTLSQVLTMPLLGTATGGEYGNLDDDIELTELHLGEVIANIAKPYSLQGDPHAYALEIVGDSMDPRFDPGDRVAVSPKALIKQGDDVIVQLRGLDGEEERVKVVLIKRLVKRSGTFVELRQYNPPMTFRVETARISAMHRVTHVIR